MKCIGVLLLVCGTLVGPQLAHAETPPLHLASLEWLPYVGRSLPDGGMSGAVAKTVAARFGHDIKIDYFPWKRAMEAGGSDPDFAGYFPAYHTDERARQCHFSASMGNSTVGLATLTTAPLRWRVLDDLAGNKLGVVLGYSNGAAFDQMIKSGKLVVDASESDTINLRKLLAGRVRAVVIDKAVLRYLLASDPALSKERAKLVFDERPLAELTLHVCFQRTPLGLKLKQSFDAALLQTDIAKIENAYFDKLDRTLGAVRR
ncbi:transporter substrate-binding domain-containing protein [Massilia antarctica]|uniref:Transporter substrate-binding domain-containing protein n=1 Tax=Massilia antarctica TaxID=2765360 RepID=A0AA48WCE9_9BURK|nr:transporter substrate-binding domain-containing protein [Massilia antarctica]QPI48989.1 transporter substrate-binding domain-containing protein [Massilia antarctica]